MLDNFRTFYMARQPIYDKDLEVFAYELLFRRGDGKAIGELQAGESVEALTNALVEIGLEKLVGDRLAFINIPEELLTSDLLRVFPKDRVILEILETIEPSDQNIAAVADLQRAGYRLALDDFVPGEDPNAFFDHVEFVKVDVLGANNLALRECAQMLQSQKIQMLAEKVETHSMHRVCKKFGFDLFQGYFFAQPAIVSHRGVPANRAALVRLLTELQDANVSMSQLEKIVSNDVTLSYRLLKLINSAYVGLSDTVDSISQALLLLGVNKVTALACLMAMSGVEDKPSELLTTAMVRARMCESVASANGSQTTERFFTAGLLSVVDALLDTPMEEIVKQLPLSSDISEALVNTDADNEVARTLKTVIAFERGDWSYIEELEAEGKDLSHSYLNAIEWATEVDKSMSAAA